MSHILAFHIGPVQDFIATARRTQDWWIGSWLLSHLSSTAIDAAKNAGAEIILPVDTSSRSDEAAPNTPNHFLAKLAVEQPGNVAKEIEQTVRNRWHEIHQQVESFLRDVPDELWTRQLETYLEIYWAIVPAVGEGEQQISLAARNLAQAALDARKRLRDFAPIREPHLKCTLCGARQELSGKDISRAARRWWEKQRRRLRLRENERLCGVCMVKRAVLAARALPVRYRDGSFPSTSSIAAAMFKKRLLETGKAKDELDEYFRTMNHDLCLRAEVDEEGLPGLARIASQLPTQTRENLLRFDGDLFYVETFTEKRFEDEFYNEVEQIWSAGASILNITKDQLKQLEPDYLAGQIASAAHSLRAVLRAAGNNQPEPHIAPPSKYFAALMMDGDHMGAFFGDVETPLAQALSRRLLQFAESEAGAIVARHLGRLVYAGGDDALALLPLETVLACAGELQEKFRNVVEETLKDIEDVIVERPTPSIGVAIAHHTQPLDATLAAMQRAERAAKHQYHRDAISVHVLKRSGEEVQVGAHWRYGAVDTMELMNRVIAAFRDETLSMKFAQAVAMEARGLSSKDDEEDRIWNAATRAAAVRAALKRLARRHAPKDKEAEAKKIASDLAHCAESLHPNEQDVLGIEEVAQWILVARFIASGGGNES